MEKPTNHLDMAVFAWIKMQANSCIPRKIYLMGVEVFPIDLKGEIPYTASWVHPHQNSIFRANLVVYSPGPEMRRVDSYPGIDGIFYAFARRELWTGFLAFDVFEGVFEEFIWGSFRLH